MCEKNLHKEIFKKNDLSEDLKILQDFQGIEFYFIKTE